MSTENKSTGNKSAENKLLRAARERTASLISPDVCLSRQELAELVNAWVWEHHHQVVDASENYLGKLERGIICWPGKLYREAFRAICGVSTDAALGFVNARARRAVVRLDDVDRRQFIHTTRRLGALAALGPVGTLLEDGEPTHRQDLPAATPQRPPQSPGPILDWEPACSEVSAADQPAPSDGLPTATEIPAENVIIGTSTAARVRHRAESSGSAR